MRRRPTDEDGAVTKAARARKHVLVVDDYEDSRAMCTEYLEYHGFRVSGAGDGPEAVRKAQDDPPDLIIMDLSLPTLDGWGAIKQLKQKGATTSDIPIVVLTGHTLDGMRERAAATGCASFMTKPCLPQDLLEEVNRVLAAQRPPRKRAGTTKRRKL
jgi:two-component system, cell cycle response regulator DivK